MAAAVVSVPIPIDTYKIGFIGAGKIAESIAGGVVKSGVLTASRIRTAHLGPARRSAFESLGIKVFDSNVEGRSQNLRAMASIVYNSYNGAKQ
ncbi:hypothetical protein Vadar_030933 [Vaccinium darrowii]|uniref:Uncharacterized protein n=1 Tax=Vaccinium darrowii TaxID=229202 RepID=A0ACB7YQP1_9ERIC|nr:hypothetical protein Vadar_030933 [Vaccinium darrowii]